MDSQTGSKDVDLWSEIVSNRKPQNPVIYTRRKLVPIKNDVGLVINNFNRGNRISLVNNKRVSWNRSLSTRGRTSIAISACVNIHPQQNLKNKTKPGLPKGKSVKLPSFEREKAYFEEVDSFELVEESPTPKYSSTWATGMSRDNIAIPVLSSVLERWLSSRKLNFSCRSAHSLSNILETPSILKESTCTDSKIMKPPEKACQRSDVSGSYSGNNSIFTSNNVFEKSIHSQKSNQESLYVSDDYQNIEASIKKLSLLPQVPTLCEGHGEPFLALLDVCGQSVPLTLSVVFSKYCALESIVKIGEGTYGEAFKVGQTVCKIVPIDGDLRVNGEVQKRSEELLEEVILCKTLNRLRGDVDQVQNTCNFFIKTIDLKVCQGSYDAVLVKAWEDWDVDHGSENDHPKDFPDKQCYMVFVLEHGGQDLESFVLSNYIEAKSLLLQVTAGLAVAETAYEFEHRDLHWGNILLSRKDYETMQFTLDGKHFFVKTFGLSISIIDFTLSRINTGEDILFLDLSTDPEIFEGPKGDKQSDTYRKMKDTTEDCWEGSFPKTNVLWLQYLVDILLLKKTFNQTLKDKRDLRSLKKQLYDYGSAKEAMHDPFFSDLFVDHAF